MTGYKRGADLEREIKKLLEACGYYVIRSAGSKGIFDLLAVKSGVCLGIQVKCNVKLKKLEELAMIQAYKRYGIYPILASKTKGEPIVFKDLIRNRIIPYEELECYSSKVCTCIINQIIKLNGKNVKTAGDVNGGR